MKGEFKESIKDINQIKKSIKLIVTIYIWAYFFSVSILYTNKYYNIGEAKFQYFRCFALVMFPIIALLVFLYLRLIKYHFSLKKIWSALTITDHFVICYMVVLIISFLLSKYKGQALTGSYSWNMGILTQFAILILYFITSYLFHPTKYFLWFFLAVTWIVMALGVINRLGLDPLNMYETYRIPRKFLSTLGQPTWYSAYLCCVLPFVIFLYWRNTNSKLNIIYGIYCATGFCSLVTQNSDSAYIGFILVFMLMFYFSFKSNELFIKLISIIVLALVCFRYMGIMKMLIPDVVFTNGKLSTLLSQSLISLLLLICMTVFLLFIYKKYKNKKLDITKYAYVPIVTIKVLIIIFFVLLLLIILTTNKLLPGFMSFLEDNNYLNFSYKWGNNRGINWIYGSLLYLRSGIITKLFGCGPDCYNPYLYSIYAKEFNEYFNYLLVVDNAHNEWLNCLVTTGLAGLITYGGIFISTIKKGFRTAQTLFNPYNETDVPLIFGIVLCTVCYMGHNIFCYQQIIATPIIFMIMGIGNGLYKNKISVL